MSVELQKDLLLQVKNLVSPLFGRVDLGLVAGECVALSGPSGAGKSRLLRAIADLDPCDGELVLNGVPRHEFSGPEWRRSVGLLPPESAWWHDQIAAHFNDAVPASLDELGLTREIMSWPVSRLSSGERQRLALVRQLCNQPTVLLLDEPTANLDPENITRLENRVGAYCDAKGAAAIWVSHDLQQIERIATRHLHLEASQLSEVTDP
jgi:ABC-type iron transport system FetAB ATPase subunit